MGLNYSIIKEEEYTDYVYDIEVKDNNNFYADKTLVHNCFISIAPKIWNKSSFIVI